MGVELHERRQVPTPPRLARPDSFWSDHGRLTRVVALLAVLLGAIYLAWRIGWTGRGVPAALFVVLLAAEIYGWVSLCLYAYTAWAVPDTPRRPLPEQLPTVDIFVCTYNEPRMVVEPTLVACASIETPHVTYVLDDGRRPEIRELAERLGAVYVTRADNKHAKAGNINHALRLTDGELILFLDCDHVPLPDVLDATIGYFDDPDVALVQTPHDFYNRDSVQHTRSVRHEQTLFYEVIAPGKDRHNAMFWCGSATLVRRHPLEEIGGVLTDTVAEDFHTTIALHARGWKTRYHNEVVVQGLAPTDLAGFLLQRARWARGNLRVFRTAENPLTCRGLTARQRLGYFASLFTYFNGFQRAALLAVLTWTLASGELPMHASPVMLVALWTPWALLGFAASGALGRGTLGFLDATRYGLMTMGIYMRGVLSLLSNRVGKFHVTPKDGIDVGGLQVLRMLPVVTAFAVALAAAALARIGALVGIVPLPDMPRFAEAVTLVLGAWELGCILTVLLALVRRRQLRTSYRFRVGLHARVEGTSAVVSLTDLSVDGAAFTSPIDIPLGTHLTLLTRVPDATGALRDLELAVDVRSSRFDEDASVYRVGSRFRTVDPVTRELLIEYCFVVMPGGTASSTRPPRPRPPPAEGGSHGTVR